eukprot:m.1652232 g.1652232  ORF g.1652232 m.1652232 type:complete len:61 (-) comp92661_c0_seq1:132-314(-)
MHLASLSEWLLSPRTGQAHCPPMSFYARVVTHGGAGASAGALSMLLSALTVDASGVEPYG